MKITLIAAIILLPLLLVSSNFAQVSEDNTLIVEDFPGTFANGETRDDAMVREALAEANLVGPNKNVTLVFTDRTWNFNNVIDFGRHSARSVGGSRRSAEFVFAGQTGGAALVGFGDSNGSICKGIYVTNGGGGGQVVGFEFDAVRNFNLDNCEVDLGGGGSIGFRIQDTHPSEGNDSCLFQNFGAKASMPIHYYSGTNMTFENFWLDCVAGSFGISAGIQGNATTVLDTVAFKNGRIYKGHHAVFFNSQVNEGTDPIGTQGLFQNLVHSATAADINLLRPAAWVMRFERQNSTTTWAQESITLIGCRNDERGGANDTEIDGLKRRPVAISCFLIGDPVAGTQRPEHLGGM